MDTTEGIRMADPTALLRAPEVAAVLRVSRAKAYQLMQSGEVTTVRVGRSVRVDPVDLARFVERSKSQAA
jgi:excisionase family DNA binding protein